MTKTSTTLAMNRDASLSSLQAHFLETSTQSMPLAGILFWSVIAIAGRMLPFAQVAYVVGFGSGVISPLAP